MTIRPIPMSDTLRQYNLARMLNSLAQIAAILFGCLILWRGWGYKTAMLLGAAVMTVGSQSGLPPWANELLPAAAIWSIYFFGSAANALAIPFAMRLFEESVGPLPRWHWRAAHGWLAFLAVYLVFAGQNIFMLANQAGLSSGSPFSRIAGVITISATLGYLIAGWRRSEPVARARFALVIGAMAVYALGWLGGFAIAALSERASYLSSAGLNALNALILGLVGPGLLAYAVLRHKLFDLGFAVNRTLVFGAIGVLLLVSFALIEWGIKQAIPKTWYGGSAYFSAVIAVGLYLTFNRLHHKVEAVIERLFFRKWQLNEAALKRFVAAAAHVEKPEALAGSFVAELTRFSGGALASLFARSPKGHYASATGETIDADDPALAALRAEQGAVVPAELGSPLEAALALPMMHQAALAGFVLLGPKPSGEDYRPDEIDNMAWATQQVGLDMQAIRVRDLELENIKMAVQIRTLNEVVASVGSAGAGGRAQ